MGKRVNPGLLRERMNYVDKPLSISYISSNLNSRYILEDYNIRLLADNIFQKHFRTQVCIERISTNILLIRILTHTSNMLVGEDSKLLEKYRSLINKKFGSLYTNIQVGILSASNSDTDVEQICRNLVYAIESTNGKNYMRSARLITEQVGKNGLLGVFIKISGRINGGTIASNQKLKAGTVKAQSISNDVKIAVGHAKTKTGMMGVKVILSRVPIVQNHLDDTNTNNNRTPRERSFVKREFKPRYGGNNQSQGGKPSYNNGGFQKTTNQFSKFAPKANNINTQGGNNV